MISVNPITPAMIAWANALEADASFAVGASREKDFDGVFVEARAEVHTWWGAHPERPPAPHKGVSLYYADATHSYAHGSASPRVLGIDISDYQPLIDWRTVVKTGRTQFMIAKATEGATNTAKSFADHWAGAKAAGIVRGAYHFFRASSTPGAQIDHFLATVGELEPRDLPPILDVEWQSPTKALGGVDRDVFADAVLDALELLARSAQRGKRPILYTAPGFWSLMPVDFGAKCAAVADLWIAHYGVATTRAIPGWARWAFWQYAEDADEPGVTTRGDANVFCGTPEDFERYVATGQLPVLDPTTALGLQVILNLRGAAPPLVEDGVAGPKTKAALVAFQAARGLPRSGVTDPATVAALLG